MRVVSDFLDRVATRAVGSESMLSPRLPSLFEPAGHAGATVAEASFQVDDAIPGGRVSEPMAPNARQQERRAAPVAAPPPALSPRSAHVASLQATPPERITVAAEAQAVVSNQPSPRAPIDAPVPPRVAWRMERAAVGELQPVRETPVLRERVITEPARDEPLGVLLPPGQPVFATRHEPEARSANTPQQPATGSLADASRETREPVVHVSIGRLEVRAAAAGAPAPRRQDSPRASALDDYLRQRGGKTP